MTEVADVVDTWQAFELHNKVALVMRMELEMSGKVPTLCILLEAHETKEKIGVVPLLASVSVRCSDMNLKHFKDALTHVLYALDFKLALSELDSANNKKA